MHGVQRVQKTVHCTFYIQYTLGYTVNTVHPIERTMYIYCTLGCTVCKMYSVQFSVLSVHRAVKTKIFNFVFKLFLNYLYMDGCTPNMIPPIFLYNYVFADRKDKSIINKDHCPPPRSSKRVVVDAFSVLFKGRSKHANLGKKQRNSGFLFT